MKYIKLYYYKNAINFGDRLSVDICKNIFNIETTYTEPQNCEAAFIGSILENFLQENNNPIKYLKKPVKIWGSGFICPEKFPESKSTLKRRLKIYALRGRLSQKRMEKIYNQKLDTPLGDPGLLAEKLIDFRNIKKEYEIGIIPHYTEYGLEVYKNIQKQIPESLIIDIRDTPKEILKKIAKCKTIISSSLHGLIAADSMHIPNIRAVASDAIIGGDYKFDDYYSAYGLTSHNKLDLRTKDFGEQDIKNIYNNYNIDFEKVENIKKCLYESFPY